MKKLTLMAVLCLALSFFSCSKDYPIEPIPEPIFNTNLPSFPLSYLYIIEKEYDLLHSTDFKQSREHYFEKRLIELFPNTAYDGMTREAKVEAEHFEESYNQYIKFVTNYSMLTNSVDSSLMVEEYQPYMSYEQEVINMNVSHSEVVALSVWDNIALLQLNKSQMDSAFHAFGRFWINDVNISYMLIPLAIAVEYSVFRILQSKIRAQQKAEFYFPNALGSGCRGDAFRHVYVSMMLRRYLGRSGSAMVMSTYERLNPNPKVSDKYMDLHNNKVGRGRKYWSFRGGYFKHRYDWERWAVNTKNYINNLQNGADMDWESGSLESCESDAEKVSSKKYIYYR
jgi:hypothetical protein